MKSKTKMKQYVVSVEASRYANIYVMAADKTDAERLAMSELDNDDGLFTNEPAFFIEVKEAKV